jgi:hypothetical protein
MMKKTTTVKKKEKEKSKVEMGVWTAKMMRKVTLMMRTRMRSTMTKKMNLMRMKGAITSRLGSEELKRITRERLQRGQSELVCPLY